mgnify:CR=1 FL=1
MKINQGEQSLSEAYSFFTDVSEELLCESSLLVPMGSLVISVSSSSESDIYALLLSELEA